MLRIRKMRFDRNRPDIVEEIMNLVLSNEGKTLREAYDIISPALEHYDRGSVLKPVRLGNHTMTIEVHGMEITVVDLNALPIHMEDERARISGTSQRV